MDLPVINAIWIGKTMGPVHRACLRSFVVTGHQVFLHTYGPVDDAPAGVWYADANRLLPEDRLLRYPNGSYALSSNLMRYELLREGQGLYVDCDVFCLRPMPDADTIFGREDDYYLNTAVLKLPMESPVLADLCAIQNGWVPPWETGPIGNPPRPLTELPWGATGPQAFTHYVRRRGLDHLAAPYDVFYPITPWRRRSLFDPDLPLEEIVTSRTKYVHLYHAMGGPEGGTPPSSPMGRLLAMMGQT